MKRTILAGVTVLSIVVPMVTGTGCDQKTPKDPASLAAADSLLMKLKQADSLLKTVDREEVEEHSEKIETDLRAVKPAIHAVGDSMAYNEALLVTDYESAGEVFEAFGEDIKKLPPRMDSMSKDLQNLAHDLRENSLAEGLDPKKCINEERDKVTRISDYVNLLVPRVNQMMKKADTLEPRFRQYMQDLNNKMAAKTAAQKK